ncbi:MAG: Crp/Fnr family transcriptional regulator [Gammaproteobacteria bacterium]|nr:Crp/Fnr family transcriptional regulator [Gammaproteobacteria bacterium]
MEINLTPVDKKRTKCSDCAIRRLSLFKELSKIELDDKDAIHSAQYKIQAKKILYKEGSIPEDIYTIYHGWVLQYKALSNGKRQVLKVALPGDLVGFQTDANGALTHTSMTLSNTILCALPISSVRDSFKEYPALADRMTQMHARDMSICQNHLIGVGQKSAEERIAYLCMEIYSRVKMIHEETVDNNIEFPLTQEEIGDAVGLTQIHVNRTLKSLREKGLLEIKGKRLYILNKAGLKDLGSFDESVLDIHSFF